MPNPSDTEKPPGRGKRAIKAAVPLAVGIKLLATAGPHHGPAFAIFSLLMILGSACYLIYAIFAPVE